MQNIKTNIIKLQQVSVKNDKHEVLKNVDLVLDAGEFCYVIGKTGTGKSTLMQLLYGANRDYTGNAKVLGTEISDLNHKTLPGFRRKLGMIFQQFHLFNEWSVYKNLSFILEATGWKEKDKMDVRIMQILKEVELQDKSSQLVYSLSGGEKQRLAISRALINDPTLILADEPTGSLDPITAKEIMLLIRKLAKQKGTAMLMTTHDMKLIQQFPGRIYECKDNTLVVNY